MDIKGDWKKRAVSGLMVLAMALSLLPTSILAADTRSVTDNAIKNGSFEQPAFDNKNSPQWDADLVPDWHTTASDQKIEFGSRRNGKDAPQLTGNDKTIPDGDQFAELNADEESTLYQYATTVGGNVYEWGLSHRGRMGVDQMAVIIGPKQDIDPAKPSKDGRDQFMRMTDWVRQHASDMGVTVSDMGCTQKITVYSKKFAANGGFQNDIGDSAFSASPSDVYTEKWNVWIIGTSNNAWGNYGTNSSDYAAGKLAYSCRYAVPDGQKETVFAFCSYSAATYNKTLGNLIDNIHFSLYQTITAAATAGGSGFIIVPTGDKGSEYYEIGSSMRELVVADGSTITVQAVEPESGDVQFVGAYVTRQTQSGLEKEFIPAGSWTNDGRTYTYKHRVEEPADIVLVFVKKPMVIYEANGGDQYTHGDNGTNAVSFAPQVSNDGSATARGPYESKAAVTTEDGWKFDGWLLARNNKVLPAVHTVSYDAASETFTFTAADGTNEKLQSGGATLIAQWKWRQRFVTASRVKSADGKVSDDIRKNTDCGSITVGKSDGSAVTTETEGAATDYYSQANEKITATAAAKEGYRFVGWYQQLDGDNYQFVSNQATYTYTAKAEGVQTIYARFAPTHTVTYQWTETSNECPTEDELEAEGMKLPAAATVMDGDNYPISTVYKANETSIPGTKRENGVTVYGKWTFSGWRDENGDIRKENLADVRKDRTLTGHWTFMPNTRFMLTYQVAENGSWTPSNLSALAAEKQYFRTEPVTAANAPTYTPGELYVDQNLTLKGAWTFGGWKRNDTKDTVAAGGEFNMPGNNVTLTGQWSFTPDTYTVSYDIGNGTGTPPESHDSYDYSALPDKAGCVEASGIPFGASIKLRDFNGTAPEGTYFAGWSIVDPTNADLGTIETQGPGAVVDDETLQITKDGSHHVTLYAVYKPVDTATVEFDATPAEGGTVSLRSGSFTVTGSTVTGGDVVSTAEPKAGWHFVGWYEKESDGSLTEAKDENGKSITGATLTVTSDMMRAKLDSLTENGTPPVFEVRYVAVFEPNTFTVCFDANGGRGSMGNQTFGGADSPRNLTKNAFSKAGYEFDGWAEYSDKEKPSDGTGTIYRDGALFENVTTYQGEQIKNGDTITLYAQWREIEHVTITYTAYPDSLGRVTLNSKDPADINTQDAAAPDTQSGIVYETLNPETGTLLGATATPNTGSVFAGWYWYNGLTRKKVYEDATFTPQQQNGRYVSASYVARFRPYRYTLHYEANGGTGKMDDQIFQHGQILPLNDCTYSREGYDFMGWSMSADNVKQFDNKAEVGFSSLLQTSDEPKDNAEATLYAVWRERDVTLNYASSDESLGTVTVGSETIRAVNGTSAGSTAQPKSGARFDGWYSADGTLLSTDLTFVPTREAGTVWQGTTYYAHFSAKRSPSTPSTPAKPDETKPTLTPIPEMLNGKDHYAYLLGYKDGTVRPNGSISRAETATIFFRLLNADIRDGNLTAENTFTDVVDGQWCNKSVSTMAKLGIVKGRTAEIFDPYAPITRAEFAVICARFDTKQTNGNNNFSDISGHWAEAEIKRAAALGWIAGYADGTFRPNDYITRAQAVTMINRVLCRMPQSEDDLLANQIVWPDNPETFWGYLAIQEATNSHEYERKADGVHETQTAKRENRDWSKEFEQ